MGKLSRPRFGSLQYWPRKRIDKALPSVNWSVLKGEGFLGFISYKAGMSTAIVKDNTANSMTKGKKIAMPVTLLEVPKMKIFSVRFYKHGRVVKDIIVSNDKELQRVLKVPKQLGNIDSVKDFDDIRVIVYPVMKDMFKKTPDMIEVAVGASDKLAFVKQHVGKEISIKDFAKTETVDVRGLTRGKGLKGAVPRFGITLKAHKSEKGVRRPGSLGPWHPHRVTFRIPMAGQLGLFTRVHYNLKVIASGSIAERDVNKKEGFRNYGRITNDYFVVAGSVQGTPKRAILLTVPLRENRKAKIKKYEFMELSQ